MVSDCAAAKRGTQFVSEVMDTIQVCLFYKKYVFPRLPQSGKSRLRSRVGTLDLYKRKAWKPYMFKVTANTYFHYFKDSDVSLSELGLELARLLGLSRLVCGSLHSRLAVVNWIKL